MELLIRKTAACALLIAALFLSSCHSDAVKKEEMSDLYELCFYFPKLPAKAALKDADAASDIYSAFLKKSGIAVLDTKTTLAKSCFLTDKEPEISSSYPKNSENGTAEYLLKAFFNKENASLYAMKNSGKTIKKLRDDIAPERKIPAAGTLESGIEIKGSEAKIIYLSRYLDNLEIKNSLGLGRETNFVLNIPADIQGRWKIALFLFNSLDLERNAKLRPGDFAILALCEDARSLVTARKNGWNRTEVTKESAENGKNAILFKSGAANLPFSEEAALKYLHSLAFTHQLPFESGSLYSPNFASSSVIPRLYLFSGELLFSTPVTDPESLFLWVASAEKQLETYSDALYANLLALKIAKRLVFAEKTFLGGKDLENSKLFIDFDTVAGSFFTSGNVSVSGEMPSHLYLLSEGSARESADAADISGVSGFKALFGDPEINDTSIVTFVVRNRNASETIEKIEKSLSEKGFSPFQAMSEAIGEGDSWGAVSVKVPLSEEKKLMNLYEKNYKTLDKTLSIGVYRVSEK